MAKVTRWREDGESYTQQYRAPCLAPGFNPDPEVTILFLERDIKCENGSYHMALAINPNGREVAIRLLEWGLDPNSEPGSVIHRVVGSHDPELITLFLDNGARIDASHGRNFGSLTHAAIGNPDPAVLALVLARGADPNAQLRDGETPLYWIAQSREPDIQKITILLEHGADVSLAGPYDRTPLHVVQSPEVADILIQNGASLDSRMRIWNEDQPGETPLHVAANSGNLELATLLLDRGADVDDQSFLSGTPLHRAVDGGFDNIEMLGLLLDRGASVNAIRPIDNYTPLTLAAEELDNYLYRYRGWSLERGPKAQDILRLLLDRGAHVAAESREGQTACDIVRDSRFSNIDQFTEILCP